MSNEALDEAIKNGLYFQHDPRQLKKRHVDKNIRDSVAKINQSGWLWTHWSCQGHLCRDGAVIYPYLGLTCQEENIPHALTCIYEALGEHNPSLNKFGGELANEIPGWRRIHVYLPNHTLNQYTLRTLPDAFMKFANIILNYETPCR